MSPRTLHPDDQKLLDDILATLRCHCVTAPSIEELAKDILIVITESGRLVYLDA